VTDHVRGGGVNAGLDRRELLRRGAALGIAAGAFGAAPSAAAAARGGTLRFARNLEPLTLVPQAPPAGENGSIWTQMQLYDQLVELLPGFALPQPGLAKSWDVARGGLRYTFHLRDAQFSNGDPVTAQDVKFSLDRFANPKINASYAFLAASIGHVTVLDPRTVRVDLKRRDGAFLFNLTIFMASIISKRVHDRIGEKAYAQQPIGSGAFVLEKWVRGQYVELARNANYWRSGKPHLDGVRFVNVPDDNARILKIQSGEVDAANPIPFSQVDRLNKVSGLSVQIEPLAALDMLIVNNKLKPLDERAVRLALNYATPRAAIAKAVFGGKVQVANSMLPKMTYWSPAVHPYPYDLDRARKLLATSSVPKGFTMPYVFIGTDTEGKQVATILKEQWRQIGVNVDLQGVDVATAGDRLGKGEFGVANFAADGFTSDVPNDDELALGLFDPNAGFNGFSTSYSSKQAAALAHRANETLSESGRRRLFAQLQRYGIENPPWVPLFFVPQRTAVRRNVHGLKTLVTGWWRLEDVSMTA
jgi:peptide/nickel transport system substrate-binding protein